MAHRTLQRGDCTLVYSEPSRQWWIVCGQGASRRIVHRAYNWTDAKKSFDELVPKLTQARRSR
jgi:hypothetical protein